VPCEGDECEASSEIGSSDSKDDPSKDGPSKENPPQNGKDGQDGRDSVDHKDSLVIDNPVDTSTVDDAKSLPECNSSNEGDAFMVSGEQTLYYCVSGKWQKNIEQLFDVKCSDGVLKFGELVATEEDSEASADYRRTGVSIKGFAEKGPFRYGTSVKIVELDSVKRLADSKRTHETCITSADGSFDFGAVNLVSPYARVEASGFYKSEFGGQSPLLTLNAVVDLSKRDSFNVNILTHMAAPRVMKLVEDSGNNQPIGSQSGRALSDVLSSFGISLGSTTGGFNGFNAWNRGGQTSTSSGKSAEDVSLFGSDDYSAALLAVSVMMQSYAPDGKFLSYADYIAEDIRGDGNWGDNAGKAKLADKLLMLDAEGGLEKIRKNMESWKLGNVPDFEKHVRNFWTKTHGFETCGSMNAGQVKHVGNSQSEYFVSYYEQPEGTRIRFICDKTTKSWRVATDIEKDTVGFGAGDYDGQLKNGKINADKFYVYEQSKKTWRAATSDDIQEFVDVGQVMKDLAAGEKVIFILRHAERTDDTGKNGHLTANGKKQSQSVGEKLKGEEIYFVNSTYTRSYETCENVAAGAGVSFVGNDTLPELDGDWFVKDDSKFETYKNNNGGGWVVTSEYAYKGSYSDAYYPLQSRGEEFMTEVVKPRFAKVGKVAVWISHDMMVVPLTAFATNGKANLRYFDTKQWINYLAGVAIILGTDGTLRFVPVKGLSSGTMTM
jgi:broad specificity phosphatase PhoE